MFELTIPPHVTVIAVSKGNPAEKILKLPEFINDIGENKIQEAEEKFTKLAALSQRKFTKHFIGHLQTNKVKKSLELFDVIQSVDSIKLAQEINKVANKKIPIILQINISNDTAKFGFKEDEVIETVINLSTLPNLKLLGLMTILRIGLTDTEIEFYYQKLFKLFTEINNTILQSTPLTTLSMGMSDDYEIAIKAGSNMVRIGRKIFNSL